MAPLVCVSNPSCMLGLSNFSGPSGGAIIVDAHEVERLVENLKPHKIGDIGSDRFVVAKRGLSHLLGASPVALLAAGWHSTEY